MFWGRSKPIKKLSRKEMWEGEKALSQDKRRERYPCGKRFVTLADIDTWEVHVVSLEERQQEQLAKYREYQETLRLEKEKESTEEGDPKSEHKKPNPPPSSFISSRLVSEPPKEPLAPLYPPDEELNRIVSLWRGDITTMEIDGIVNAANESLLGGGGIDGAIHRAAGDELYFECKQLEGCETGGCKVSRGYRLPATHVLHTVGPIGEYPKKLIACYENCLLQAVKYGLRSIAFCGISTGIYGYPLYPASHVAIKTIREWLDKGDNRKHFDRIIFCVFLEKELTCYEHLLPAYFPKVGTPFTAPKEDETTSSSSSVPSPSGGDNGDDSNDDDDGDEINKGIDKYDDVLVDGDDNKDKNSETTDKADPQVCAQQTISDICGGEGIAGSFVAQATNSIVAQHDAAAAAIATLNDDGKETKDICGEGIAGSFVTQVMDSIAAENIDDAASKVDNEPSNGVEASATVSSDGDNKIPFSDRKKISGNGDGEQ